MEITGLPVHILVLHAAVVLAPLMALAALGYVAVSRWRIWLAGPLLGLSLVATAATLVTGHFGEELEKAMPHEPLIQTHALYGGIAEKVVAALFFAVVLAVLAFDERPSRRFSWLGRFYGSRTLRVLWAGLTVVLALATIVTITLAGHSGAASAWTGWRHR